MEFSENTENQRCAGLDEVSHLQPAKDFQSTTKAWEQRSYPGNWSQREERMRNEGCKHKVLCQNLQKNKVGAK